MPKVARAVRVLSVPPLTRVDRHVRARAHWSGSTLIVALTIGVLVAGGLPLLRSPFGVPVAGSEPGDGRRSVPVEIAALAASSVPTASPVAAYPYTTPPPPGVTPSPEPDPGRYSPAGISLAATSSSRVLAIQIGKELIPGYQTVSFRLSLTLGSDFATRLDRSIRLYGSDNIRYLADEAVVAPEILGKQGPDLDGWVTFLLPVGMTGPATIHIAIDPGALTEIVIPVVIGVDLLQPTGVYTPTSLLLAVPADTSN